MVSSTSNPLLWRVELERIHSDTTKVGIVCYVNLIRTGLKVYYSHECMYSRPIAKGPWTAGMQIRQPLGGALKSTIEAGILNALWDMAKTEDIETWPGDPNDSPEGVDLDL
jgi:hypothetical protein